MNVVVKEDGRMAGQTKTYLQMYEEYLIGYKQYKMEKNTLYFSSDVSAKEEQELQVEPF